MAKVIDGLVPPGGWHFVDGDAKLSAYSLNNLYEVVENYRAENHFPIGDVRGDVDSFICGSFPKNCHGVDSVTVTSVVPPNRQSELLNDIVTWSKNILNSQKPILMVSDDLAEQRSKICINCTKNINWQSGCGSCVAATQRLTSAIRQGRDTHTSKWLGGCSIMRHDNRAAVFFDKDHFNKSNDLPENCWLKLNG
jgi:hypothetical protein